jgi:hypothetical protein
MADEVYSDVEVEEEHENLTKIDQLINYVKTNPVLYDLNHYRYHDTDYKNRLWTKIGDKLSWTGDTIYIY